MVFSIVPKFAKHILLTVYGLPGMYTRDPRLFGWLDVWFWPDQPYPIEYCPPRISPTKLTVEKKSIISIKTTVMGGG